MPNHKKDPSVRARTNTASTATVLAQPSRRKRVPAMPKLPCGGEWHAEVKAWWASVWRSPMAAEYVDVDKYALHVLALLMQDFWTAELASERQRLAAEIRLQRTNFGQTPYDRRRLEWTIGGPDERPARTTTAAGTGVAQAVGAEDPRHRLHSVS